MRVSVSSFVFAGAVAIPAATIGLGLTNTAGADEVRRGAERPELILVDHYADWCGKCQALKAPLEAALDELADEPVLFVKFDFTDKHTKQQAEFLAAELGLDDEWNDFGGKTGFIVVIDTETREIVDRLRSTDSDELVMKIKSHLDG